MLGEEEQAAQRGILVLAVARREGRLVAVQDALGFGPAALAAQGHTALGQAQGLGTGRQALLTLGQAAPITATHLFEALTAAEEAMGRHMEGTGLALAAAVEAAVEAMADRRERRCDQLALL